MSNQIAARPPIQKPLSITEQLLTIEQLAHILQVPVETVRTWRKKGYGPKAFKVGKHLRYDLIEVYAWLESSR